MKQLSFGLVVRLGLLVFGLLIAKTGTRVIEFGSEAGYYVHETPSIYTPFWIPHSYKVVQTPDYSFKLLAIGVCMATTGFWATLDELKRLNMVTESE